MKKLCKFSVILAAGLIIALSFTSCGKGALNGTWVSGNESITMKNGVFTVTAEEGEFKGKYTTSGKDNISLTIEEVRGDLFSVMGLPSNKWFTEDSLKKAIIDLLVEFGFSAAEAEQFYNEEPDLREMSTVFSSLTGTYTKDTMKINTFGDITEYKKQK